MSNELILKKHRPLPENLLMILHDLQDHHPQHYLTPEALESTAAYLNLTKATVYGVAGYYSMFSLKPRGKYIIRVCGSAVCDMLGSDSVLGHLERILGVKAGETTPCGLFTVETSECLGQCHEAPSMMINQEVYNKLNGDRIRETIQQLRMHETNRMGAER
jgi:NADH-quinone oxidoreductase subunit E